MLKKVIQNKYLFIILLVGIAIRISLFIQSPPSNAYDDHLEVIATYAETFQKPMPSDCWECYQPPIYYSFAALIYRFALNVNLSNLHAWKLVQSINILLSILVLIVFLKILALFEVKMIYRSLYLTFLAFLPRDIMTSSMIGNDYLLIFCTSVSLLYFFKIHKAFNNDGEPELKHFALLSLFVIIGALTKQHGLLLLFFPAYVVLHKLVKKGSRPLQPSIIIIFFVTCIISLSDEIWKFNKTGVLLVSNQNFFDYAKNQFPGSLEKVEFFTFRFIELIKMPFISDSTAASFPTEIFARFFFDYEWRFLSPKIPAAILIGRIAYFVGLGWVAFMIITTVKSISLMNWRPSNIKKHSSFIVAIFIGVLFFLVPVVQTFRFPYFSSMKAMFVLPGYFILLVTFALLTKNIVISTKIINLLIILNFILAVLLTITISSYLDITLNHLNGPLWKLPN